MERKLMYDIDQFLSSVDVALDPNRYKPLLATATGGRLTAEFQRVPFQQLMLLHSVVVMTIRSGLREHAPFILECVKVKFGFGWLTRKKIDRLLEVLELKVFGHSVRRRMGKSVAVYADLARSVALFPRAGLKALYTVHQGAAAQDCFSNVSKAVMEYVTDFNKVQLESYKSRIRRRQGTVDENDFYYKAKVNTARKSCQIECNFHKFNREGDTNAGGRPVSTNYLRCKAYTQKDVSCFFCFFYIISPIVRKGGGVINKHLPRGKTGWKIHISLVHKFTKHTY